MNVENMMLSGKQLYITSRKEWRSWLEKNHKKEKEIWLIYYKKHTGKPRITYEDAVQEALCFGWIDSIVKKIDDEKYCQKFTPRKNRSRWSESNKKRVKKLIEQGHMADAGLAKVECARSNGEWNKTIPSKQNFDIPIAFKQALNDNKKAGNFFNRLSPSFQKQYIGWIATAKRKETREKRINEAISLLSKNQKLGMK